MEIKTLTDKQVELIKKPLPAEAVKQHPTKTYLSSIKAIYVTERLNEVFGVGVWQIKTNEVSTSEKGMVVCKVILEMPSYGIYYESFGGNDNGGAGSKNFDLGDAYKGATTDAITKICSYIGIGIDVFKGKQSGSASGGGEAKTYDNGPTEKHTCTKCGVVVEASPFKGKFGMCFKCPECSQFSKTNPVYDGEDISKSDGTPPF